MPDFVHLIRQITPVFVQLRAASLALVQGLSDEDCCVQAMPDASPQKWHLAHTTWFFETFILADFEAHFVAFQPAFKILFNSYYNGVGEKHPRSQRGLLTRPSLAQVLDYRTQVDARMLALLHDGGQAKLPPERCRHLLSLLKLGIAHEQQHQELMQTDLLYLFSCNPLLPVWRADNTVMPPAQAGADWLEFDAQLCEIGFQAQPGLFGDFCFDNELPRHRQFIEPYALATRLVSNAQYLAFMQAGGYAEPEYWLADGWDFICRERITHPLYWQLVDGSATWHSFSLHGLQPLCLHAPVMHLSYFEADAFARWQGARLPTEAEMEAAGNSEQAACLQDLFGKVWQWTSSSYAPYPGYAPAAGAVGEYNGKFMHNQYVLRGSSLATTAGHARNSYRNFFPSHARWQFTGLRLARSV